ncbi:hypothetical protein KM043_000736 [Ampulex compressa]|nr:hypothetical protein KM043_000736 [Ampulex compressa]
MVQDTLVRAMEGRCFRPKLNPTTVGNSFPTESDFIRYELIRRGRELVAKEAVNGGNSYGLTFRLAPAGRPKARTMPPNLINPLLIARSRAEGGDGEEGAPTLAATSGTLIETHAPAVHRHGEAQRRSFELHGLVLQRAFASIVPPFEENDRQSALAQRDWESLVTVPIHLSVLICPNLTSIGAIVDAADLPRDSLERQRLSCEPEPGKGGARLRGLDLDPRTMSRRPSDPCYSRCIRFFFSDGTRKRRRRAGSAAGEPDPGPAQWINTLPRAEGGEKVAGEKRPSGPRGPGLRRGPGRGPDGEPPDC